MRQNRTVQIGLNSAHVVVYRSDCRYLPYSSRVFLSLCQYRSRENGQNTKILEVRHFRMIRKWPPTATRRAKH